MRQAKLLWMGMALVIALGWAVATPVEVRAAGGSKVLQNLLVEERPLYRDDGTCQNVNQDADYVGQVRIANLGFPKVGVTVRIGDPANPGPRTNQVFWVCSTVQNGCSVNSCGFVSIGTLNQNQAGNGNAQITLPNGNPFPGENVHIVICPGTVNGCDLSGPFYDATFASVFQDPPGISPDAVPGSPVQ